MADEPERQVPEGAAVFPLIPPELGADPLLLAVLHATVFLDGSEDDVVNPAAAEEALEYLASYLQRLDRSDLQRIREDIEVLLGFARQEKWPREQQQFLKGFLADYGIGGEHEA
jgi:hypothetical protein